MQSCGEAAGLLEGLAGLVGQQQGVVQDEGGNQYTLDCTSDCTPILLFRVHNLPLSTSSDANIEPVQTETLQCTVSVTIQFYL